MFDEDEIETKINPVEMKSGDDQQSGVNRSSSEAKCLKVDSRV